MTDPSGYRGDVGMMHLSYPESQETAIFKCHRDNLLKAHGFFKYDDKTRGFFASEYGYGLIRGSSGQGSSIGYDSSGSVQSEREAGHRPIPSCTCRPIRVLLDVDKECFEDAIRQAVEEERIQRRRVQRAVDRSVKQKNLKQLINRSAQREHGLKTYNLTEFNCFDWMEDHIQKALAKCKKCQ